MLLRDTTEVIWAFTGTVLGLIVCVGIASVLRQIRHNSEGSSQADKWENATDSVMGFIDGDELRLARFSKLLKADETRPIVIEALSNASRTNANCAVRLRDRDADVAILRQWVADSLEDKDAGRRAHACEVVGTLRLRACRGMVLAATGDDDVNVKVSATRAMAVIDPESAVGVLLGLIEEEGSWAADLLADLLQRIPTSATDAVVLRAREWGATPALVKLLASSPSAAANDVLLGALETEDPELRARTAEAVHASSPEAVMALCALLTDPHEGTRLSAVRSLSRASNPEALMTLSSALSDSSRLVRFAAASGIAGTQGGGEVLSRVVTGSDRNAAEAAELALWRLNSGALTVGPSEESLRALVQSSAIAPVRPSPESEQSDLTALSRMRDWTAVSESSDLTDLTDLSRLPRLPRLPELSEMSELTESTELAEMSDTPLDSAREPAVAQNSGAKLVVRRKTGKGLAAVRPPGRAAPAEKTESHLEPRGLQHRHPKAGHPKPALATLAGQNLALGSSNPVPRRSAEVLAWLEAFLAAHDGVASAPAVKTAAAKEGIAERTLERVRPMIATSMRQGFGEPANWELRHDHSVSVSTT